MSKMYPDCPTDTHLQRKISESHAGWRGEREVYKFFRDYMPNDWHVIWNAKTDRSDVPEHQLDFVVLVPGMGALNLEVKEGKDGYELVVDENGNEKVRFKNDSTDHDIYSTASGVAHELNNYVLQHITNNRPWGVFGHLVVWVFTSCLVRKSEEDAAFSLMGWRNSPTAFAQELQQRIRERLSPPSISEARRARLYSCFTRERLDELVRHLKEPEEEPLQEDLRFLDWDQVSETMLTEPQKRVFHMLLCKDCCHVKGAAGTGKSIIAIALAKRYAQQGKAVLYVCFNRALADKLDRKIGNFPGRKNLAITNFDRIQTQFGRSSEYTRFGNNRTKWDQYLEETLPALANKKGRFDVLIVDEAQDLSQKELLILLSCLQEKRKIVLFSDAEQTIFSYENNGAWNYDEQALFQGEHVEPLSLTTNYRNVCTIHEVMDQYEPNHDILPYWDESTLGSLPVPVQHIPCREVPQKLSEVLEHAGPHQIAFLSSQWDLLASFQNRPDAQGRQIRFVGDPDHSWEAIPKWERGEGILKATIQGFKGLDADVVFLFGINDKDVKNELKYVGLSRAKYELYVVE